MFTPARLCEVICSHPVTLSHRVIAFWYQLNEGREQYAAEIKRLRGALPVVPLLPRKPMAFLSPNSILADLRALIDDAKSEFESLTAPGMDKSICLVILSRSRMDLPQITSPMVLPSWFPVCPSHEIQIVIVDVLSSTRGPLNSTESKIANLHFSLYQLDKSALRMLKRSAFSSRSALLRCILPSRDSQSDFMNAYEKFLDGIDDPYCYRLSGKNTPTFCGRLLHSAYSENPSGIRTKAIQLGKALPLAVLPQSHNLSRLNFDGPESLVAAIMRPMPPLPDYSARLAFSLLVSIYAASQFITITAHSAEYPHFSLNLLSSFSTDLSDTIFKLASALDAS